MGNTDEIRKYLAYDGKVLISVINATNLVEQAKKIHNLTPTTTAVLGRVLTITALMGIELKNINDSITVQIKGDGPVGSIIAISDKFPKVRACMQNPQIELELNKNGKIDVGGAVGNVGYLNIIKDIGLKKPYIGIVPLETGEIAEDFAKYFAESEQKPSAIALGVLVNKSGVNKAGGYLLTLMPDVTEEIVTKVEENIKKMPQISKILAENKNLDEIAKIITGDNNIKIIEKNIMPVYECNCSQERFEEGLISLGKKELEKIINEDGKAEIECNFCNKKYLFDKAKLIEILDKI